MTVERNAIFKGNAAYLCRYFLGDRIISNWDDFLADCTRERAEVAGLTLLPCGRLKQGGIRRPLYDLDALMRFIRDVRAASSEFEKTPVKPFFVEVDTRLPWTMNIVDRFGRLTRAATS
jgi:hypothetical protein